MICYQKTQKPQLLFFAWSCFHPVVAVFLNRAPWSWDRFWGWNTLRPSIEYLEQSGRLMLDSSEMAAFLGVSEKAMTQLASTDRVPGPCRLGLGTGLRWSVLELLEWIEAGCPRRDTWIKLRGRSGRYYG